MQCEGRGWCKASMQGEREGVRGEVGAKQQHCVGLRNVGRLGLAQSVYTV